MATPPDKLDSNVDELPVSLVNLFDYLNNQTNLDTVYKKIRGRRTFKINNKVNTTYIVPYGERTAEDVLMDAICRIFEGIRQIERFANINPNLPLDQMRKLVKKSIKEQGLRYRLPWYAINDIQDGQIIWRKCSNKNHENYLIGVINSIGEHEAIPRAKYHRNHIPYDESDNPGNDLDAEPEFDPRDKPKDTDNPWRDQRTNTSTRDESPHLDEIDQKKEEEELNPETVQKQKLGKSKTNKKEKFYQLPSDAYRFRGDVLKNLIAEEDKLEHDERLRKILVDFKNSLPKIYLDTFEAIYKICDDDLNFKDEDFDGRLPHGTQKIIADKLGVSPSDFTYRCENLAEFWDRYVLKNKSSTISQGDSE